MAKSLLPLGGFRCVGRAARPLFARPDAMLFQMRQLEAHCRALWTRRLARPGAGRQDVFLLDYLPPPCRAGRCSAAGMGPEAGARAVWRRRRGWPCVRDTGPRLVPPACSGAPSTAASGPTKGTAWTRLKRARRHERCGRGCSPRSQPGPAPWRRPRPHGARPARANVLAHNLPHQRARRDEHAQSTSTCDARRSSRPPPPQASPWGGHTAQRLRYVKRAERAQAAPPALPAPPSGNRRARGGTRSTGVTRAGRSPGRTHTRGGGTTASPPPPFPRVGGYFRGHLPPADGGAGGVISQRGGHCRPPPPPRGGGQERGTSVDPHPHPSGGGAQGAEAETSAAQVEQDPPSPQGAGPGQPRQILPPSPPQKRAQRVGGKRTGQQRRPMQTLCDEHRAPACKSCKGRRGVRHCCSRHNEGHPRVRGGGGGGGGGNSVCRFKGGGCISNWALCPSEGRCAHRHPRSGEGAAVRQGRGQ